MRYTSETHNLLDTALELTGQPVQLRVTNPEGISEHAVGALVGAYYRSETRLTVGAIAIAIKPVDQWEIVTHERPETENAEPETASPFAEHAPEPDVQMRAVDHNERDGQGYPVIHALRWENGVAVGYHPAAIVGRLSMDALKVRFVLDGKESGAYYSGIRATQREWKTIEQYAKHQ